jgi:hypothetical protein
MVSSGINYRETYFEFPELTKLQGEPNAESILKLRNELKANAQAVYSNLSDGAHGHLALVISDAQYANITAQPFIRPVFPGPLAIPAGTTAAMATTLKEAHHEEIRLFREVQGVEKALVQQIVQAVDSVYLATLRDRTSNSIQGSVHDILAHLQTNYGHVSPQMLDTKETELRTLVYNTQEPIDKVFNAVEDYADYAFMADQELSAKQTIAKAYVILNNTRRFKSDITDWNRLAEPAKTWLARISAKRNLHNISMDASVALLLQPGKSQSKMAISSHGQASTLSQSIRISQEVSIQQKATWIKNEKTSSLLESS